MNSGTMYTQVGYSLLSRFSPISNTDERGPHLADGRQRIQLYRVRCHLWLVIFPTTWKHIDLH